jgi:hypothetical protein
VGHRHLGIKSNTCCPVPQLRSGINVDVETLMKKLRLSTIQATGAGSDWSTPSYQGV